ncbi:hypothetical protein [Cecembia calidifontis]|jgi:hypothetical protein|uniref:Uncharacterized protein n=1 Tax=Cecembia calidifontis TaxID=1187080 RepID=A0A4V2F6V0_9BACT|nr:hypothetical protein [Cecembia calidifontis]RZS97589.1 hypothetical protein BC751_3204 [Cecembia calidifontis]
MQIPSLAEFKKELSYLDAKELTAIILELSKFSKDNKGYLFFRLFERDNPNLFVEMCKEDLDMAFMDANIKNYHLAKKSAQAIRRKLNKNLKLSKNKEAHIEMILYFCSQLKRYGFLAFRHPVIDNLYRVQLGKAEKLIEKLHEDLQYDFQIQLEELKG